MYNVFNIQTGVCLNLVWILLTEYKLAVANLKKCYFETDITVFSKQLYCNNNMIEMEVHKWRQPVRCDLLHYHVVFVMSNLRLLDAYLARIPAAVIE